MLILYTIAHTYIVTLINFIQDVRYSSGNGPNVFIKIAQKSSKLEYLQ